MDDKQDHHLRPDEDARSASSSSASPPGKSIRFFEYASVIPQLDPEQLHEHVVQAYGHHGRPHLTSRTYSVPIPSSITSLFASPPPREYTYDPAFIPNSPPRLNFKLPSFVRKRRNTIACQSHLKSILKKRKTVIVGTAKTISPTTGSAALITAKGSRGRSHTLASSAPASAPSASCSISNINPVYCPALARVVSRAADAQLDSASSLASSPPSARSQLSTTPPNVDSSSSTVLGTSPTHPMPPETTELLPIRDCCRACRKAATWGQKCGDSNYHEHWSKAALEKRKRDEETKYERGEYTVSHDDDNAARKKLNREGASGDGNQGSASHEAGSDIVQAVEKLEREEAKHHHCILSSPTHSPLLEPSQQHSSSSSTSSHHTPSPHHSPPLLPPVLAHVHDRIQACQELKKEKQQAHEEELDAARKRIARLDIGKKFVKHDEEEDRDRDSACSDEQEGNDLRLEGIDEGTKTSSAASASAATQDEEGNAPSRKASVAVDDELEKNPICTLDGQILRPCSSKSLYTGGPSFRRSPLTASTNTGIGSVIPESDQVSNTSSSDLSEDIVSNLSSLGLSPASATTNASSWFGGEELSSPPERSLKEGTGEKDYFGSSFSNQAIKGVSAQKEIGQEPNNSASASNIGSGCSPLMRTKCLRPAGMYAPLPAVGGDESKQSTPCTTIREESTPSTPTGSHPSSRQTIRRANTTPISSSSVFMDQEAELREALKEADKPLFSIPIRTQSLPADSSGRRNKESPANIQQELEENNGHHHNHQKVSWTRRILNPGRTFSALGVAHGIVH